MSNSVYARALYDFDSTEANILPLREGELVLVTERRDDGWWGGVANGRSGFFPANYVEITDNAAAAASTPTGGYAEAADTVHSGHSGKSLVGAGAVGAAAGYMAGRRQNTGVGAIHAGDSVYTGKDEYIIEEEKWYLRYVFA